MGNGKSSKRNSKKSATAIDLPVLKVDGISYSAVNDTLGKLREGKENQLDEDKLLSYNFLDTMSSDKRFADLCVLGHVNATPGCRLLVSECQDDAFISENSVSGASCSFVGVFDGHGRQDGAKVSKCCSLMFQDIIQGKESPCTKSGKKLRVNSEVPTKPNVEQILSEPKEFFDESFKFMHEVVCSANDFSAKEAGTTATVASLIDNKLNVAWVGDSQAAIFVTSSDEFDNFVSYFVTSRHNFQTEEEKTRVAKNGGRLGHPNNVFGKIDPYSSEPLRIFGKRGNMKPGLMISKSLGDQHAHKIGLTCEPSYISIDFNEVTTFGDLVSAIPSEFNASSMSQGLLIKPPPQEVSRRNKRGMSFQQTLGRARKSISRTLGPRKKSKKQISGITNGSSRKFEVDASAINNTSREMMDMSKPIKHCVLVVASDGLWDHISRKEVANLLPAILKERSENPTGVNIGLELGLKAIEKFRASFKTPTTQVKSDDITVVSSVLF